MENICVSCNRLSCACVTRSSFSHETDIHNETFTNCVEVSVDEIINNEKGYCNNIDPGLTANTSKSSKKSINSVSVLDNISTTQFDNINDNFISFNLSDRGFNFGHLNIQGICGKDMTKFAELKLLLTNSDNNNLHVFGVSETMLKSHKSTNAFIIEGFQTPYRKDNTTNGGGGLLVYVRNGINVKRREDLETNGISCIWLEILQEKGKSF